MLGPPSTWSAASTHPRSSLGRAGPRGLSHSLHLPGAGDTSPLERSSSWELPPTHWGSSEEELGVLSSATAQVLGLRAKPVTCQERRQPQLLFVVKRL